MILTGNWIGMNNIKRLAILLLFLFPSFLFARGSGGTKREIKDNEWILCVTEFDASRLPAAQRAAAGYIERELTKHLSGLDYKLRNSDEYYYHWTAAWLSEQSTAAKKLVEKQKQRDELIFKPLADWEYKAQLKKIDDEIVVLREGLDDAELKSPDIGIIPEFNVTKDNENGIFPPPPKKDKEYFFCKEQKANGFLSGTVSLYHERILVEVRLWSMWSRSYSFEDSIIFSIEDIDSALNELVGRLINLISGMEYSIIIVRAEPDNTVVVVDDQFASENGETGEIWRTPGPVEITAYAENHIPLTTVVDLNEGERADISFSLTPIPQAAFTVDTKSGEPAMVYRGSLFAGMTPLMLAGPLGEAEQVSVQTGDNRTTRAVFQINDNSKVLLDPIVPPASDRIEKARKSFYGAFGRLWIGLPICTLLWGTAQTFIGTTYDPDYSPTKSSESAANIWYYIQPAVLIVGGLLVADAIVRLIIYIYQGNKPGSILPPREAPLPEKTPLPTPDPLPTPTPLPTPLASD
jgi:hypothetical protein